jgi:hypothetical protein
MRMTASTSSTTDFTDDTDGSSVRFASRHSDPCNPCNPWLHSSGHAIDQRVAALPVLELAGNSYRGVGIPQSLRSGRTVSAFLMRAPFSIYCDHSMARLSLLATAAAALQVIWLYLRASRSSLSRRDSRKLPQLSRFSIRRCTFTILAGELCALAMLNWAFGLAGLGHGVTIFWFVTIATAIVVPFVGCLIAAHLRALAWGVILLGDVTMAYFVLSEVWGVNRYQNMTFLERRPEGVRLWVASLVAVHLVFLVATFVRRRATIDLNAEA